jgi:predicted Zn-dependent protease
MNRRKFLNYIGCGCSGLMMNGCSTAPITDRKQFKIIPEAKLNAQAAAIYEKVKKKEKMSTDKKKLNEIIDIGKKMEASISEYFTRSDIEDPTVSFDWEYILIDNEKVKNAWCMPGGKIAIYTGILDITKNTNGLAAVMGHEIAHAVAKHSVERASQAVLLNVGTTILDNILDGALSASRVDDYIVQLGINLPYGRLQESEADYLGLIFMTLAGYDNRAAIGVWERMEEASKGRTVPEFLSTHPTPGNRIKKIQEWIPEINGKYT